MNVSEGIRAYVRYLGMSINYRRTKCKLDDDVARQTMLFKMKALLIASRHCNASLEDPNLPRQAQAPGFEIECLKMTFRQEWSNFRASLLRI